MTDLTICFASKFNQFASQFSMCFPPFFEFPALSPFRPYTLPLKRNFEPLVVAPWFLVWPLLDLVVHWEWASDKLDCRSTARFGFERFACVPVFTLSCHVGWNKSLPQWRSLMEWWRMGHEFYTTRKQLRRHYTAFDNIRVRLMLRRSSKITL